MALKNGQNSYFADITQSPELPPKKAWNIKIQMTKVLKSKKKCALQISFLMCAFQKKEEKTHYLEARNFENPCMCFFFISNKRQKILENSGKGTEKDMKSISSNAQAWINESVFFQRCQKYYHHFSFLWYSFIMFVIVLNCIDLKYFPRECHHPQGTRKFYCWNFYIFWPPTHEEPSFVYADTVLHTEVVFYYSMNNHFHWMRFFILTKNRYHKQTT